MKRWAPGLVDTDAVDMLPKRQSSLELRDGKRDVFWGLLIREARSDFIVSLYVLLFNLPGLVFFFLWLFLWNHDSDLQNAAVPVLTSLSLTIGFVGFLYHKELE
jgi:hypothetical protein